MNYIASYIIDIMKRQKSDWDICQLEESLAYNPDSPIFELNPDYLKRSGLPEKEKLVLFCRPMFHEQFNFLQEQVLNKSVFGWIAGPPGCGKSTTTLAFAATIDRSDWIVTWIHFSRIKNPVCIRFDGQQKKMREISDPVEIEDIIYLDDAKQSLKHIVILDGFVSAEESHSKIQRICLRWSKKDTVRRRLVVVSSMSAPIKVSLSDQATTNLETLFVYSWRKEEYLEAVKNDAFFDSVADYFIENRNISGESITASERAALVESKFHLAGGCSRFMFSYPASEVIKCIKRSIFVVNDVQRYLEGYIGDRCDAVVNRLFGRLNDKYHKYHSYVGIVSQYAASEIALKNGPEFVRRISSIGSVQNNDNGMKDWMLEMFFFASINAVEGAKSLTVTSSEKTDVSWPSSYVVSSVNWKQFNIQRKGGIWIKTQRRNQGGYDAVFIDKEKRLVRMVQVASDDIHMFKIGFFYEFLKELCESEHSFEINSLEIVFIVDEDKMDLFKISSVEGEGLLASFGSKWSKGNECNSIDIVCIKGFKTPN